MLDSSLLLYIYNARRSCCFPVIKKKKKERKSGEEEGKDLIYLSFGEREIGRGSGSWW